MPNCAILGDSIAVGVWWHRPECAEHARIGISAAAFVGGPRSAREVVISLGSNDAADPTDALIRLRASIQAERVVWIVPAYRNGDAVRMVASLYRDQFVEFTPGVDGVHPRSYPELAEKTKEARND
jgi:hypothetical protein